MKISVIGTGAVGGYYGMMLAGAGHEVHFLLRSDYEYAREHGLKLCSAVHADLHLPEINAWADAAGMPAADIVLVGLKTTQNEPFLSGLLSKFIDDGSIVVLIQNGLGMEHDLATRFPGLQIAGGVALIGAHKAEKGTIIHQDYGKLDLGSYNVRNLARLHELSSHLKTAGVPSSVAPLDELRWKKLVWNMAFNGLSVVLNKNTGEILSNRETLDWCRLIMIEVISAANAGGLDLANSFADQMIEFTRKMRPYLPSMKLDFDNGRPLELEYLYQRPIEISRANGFEMAQTSALFEQVKQLAEQRFI